MEVTNGGRVMVVFHLKRRYPERMREKGCDTRPLA